MSQINIFFYIFFFFGFITFFFSESSKELSIEVDKLNTTEIIEAFGYPVEIHQVVTDDGYILTNFRIPHGKTGSTRKPNRYPVLLHHGIMTSAECFLWGLPKKTTAYFLADHGFDVWLLNDRGTLHSRKHMKLNPDLDKQFWKFTFHEIAIYDIANTIDYILNVTQKEKLFYVGHSQGGMAGIVLLTEKPEYNKKIILYVVESPGIVFEHVRQPLIQIAVHFYGVLQKLGEAFENYELLPKMFISNEQFRRLAKMLCGHNGLLSQNTCIWVMSLGSTENQIDPNSLPFIIASPVGGSSLYQGIHFLQLISKNKFVQMDWGTEENLERYNSTVPPEYNLTKAIVPIALMYGLGDIIVAPEDIVKLSQLLPNVVDLYQVPYQNWTHTDFLWAKDLKKYILDHLLELLYGYIN